ncbi:type II toxin-antitoxin system RelB/DinJ family antitoxin [Kallipyga gabonensis]|uniref:type II toxin-antitoxin system RelB/DinJ family antitoxin n=1 Tax=Kallipyga gabonensis TaxID=1686287 RepID=UPI0006B59B74|nr:type II toxin-antitoxin system RelB/DinJ family antitoxin [Kallipyga gabonensis]
MANTQNFSVRMDKKVKKESEILFQNLGMNLTTAINVFLRQAIRTGGFPFEIKVDRPNRETLLSLIEADVISEDENAPGYDDVEEALRELKQ